MQKNMAKVNNKSITGGAYKKNTLIFKLILSCFITFIILNLLIQMVIQSFGMILVDNFRSIDTF